MAWLCIYSSLSFNLLFALAGPDEIAFIKSAKFLSQKAYEEPSSLILKILYIAHRIPYPPNKGDKIRSFNEIKHLSKDHDLDLTCLVDDIRDLSHVTDLKNYCSEVCAIPLNKAKARFKGGLALCSKVPLSVKYFYSGELQKRINTFLLKSSYDAIICFSSSMAEYVFQSPRLSAAKPCASRYKPGLIMDFCDVDSDKWAQYAKQSSFPFNIIYKIESKRLLEYEKKVNRFFDYSVFVSQKEAELFLKLFSSAKNICVIPNGVDYEYFSPCGLNLEPCALSLKPPTLVFTGAMDYYANIDGVTWFCKDIMPLIQSRYPELKLYIVGSNPAPEVKKLEQNKGVRVTGFVDDIRPYYDGADICVTPLRLARGIQNKVLEAMAMEKAVVTTSKALEGISAVPGEHVLVADDPKEFAHHILDLLSDNSKRKLMGKRARQFIVQNYDWQTSMKKLDQLLLMWFT